MLAEVGSIDLEGVPQAEAWRRKVLRRGQEVCVARVDKRREDPQVHHVAGRAHGRLDDIHEFLGEHTQARQAYEQAIALLDAPTESAGVEMLRRRELARCRQQLGVLRYKLSDFARAEALLQQALAD